MRLTERALNASGLPLCWATVYEELTPAPALREAVRHTVLSLNRTPAAYRWVTAVVLRLFPAVFWAVTRRRPGGATPEQVADGLARLRRLPGVADVLRATTALALYGALDSRPPRDARAGEAMG